MPHAPARGYVPRRVERLAPVPQMSRTLPRARRRRAKKRIGIFSSNQLHHQFFCEALRFTDVFGQERLDVTEHHSTVSPPRVVPANAGTHNHRLQLFCESRRTASFKSNRRGVWVPAFAGTTLTKKRPGFPGRLRTHPTNRVTRRPSRPSRRPPAAQERWWKSECCEASWPRGSRGRDRRGAGRARAKRSSPPRNRRAGTRARRRAPRCRDTTLRICCRSHWRTSRL